MPLIVAGIVIVLICFVFAFIGNLIDDIIFNFAPVFKILIIGGCFYGCYYFLKASKEVSQNTDLIKVDESMTKKLSDDKQPDIPTFNLSNLNLLELSNELKNSLNNTSSSFIWIRKRENEKLKLQKEKITLILDAIQKLTLTQKELINFQSETFLSNEMLDAVIASKKHTINNLAEVQRKEYLIIHKNLDDELSKIDHSKKAREILIESAELENLKKKAEINLMTSKTDEAKAKAQLIMYVVKELDLKNMPQTLQTYLISSIVNPQGGQYQDFDMQEQLKQFVVKEADAKSRQSLAVATQAEHQTRIAEKTADSTVLNLDTANRNSLNRK